MQLYNTLHGAKEPFSPARDNRVSLYACGITAYDLCHIGHARSAVVFDVLVRHLRAKGFEVAFARNFTDVDDKIINRANQEGLSSKEVAEKYIAAFHEDMDRLSVLRADVEPKATEHIPEMIELTEKLISQGNAYATSSGDVYFRVRSFADYGKLSGRNPDEMRAGARVEPGEEKEDPLDFALWKAAKPGEPFWDSPWGQGRPGWHLECSAMNETLFELPIDIHGGGKDLIFPHHENEIAQSEAASGKEFARFWVHNGFVQIDAEKMAKSLGNFKTIREILESFHPETLRFFLLTRHYRSPVDFTAQAMEEAEKNVHRIYTAKLALEQELERKKWSQGPLPEDLGKELDGLEQEWAEAMDDDLNTAAALASVFGVVRLANRIMEDKAWRKTEAAKAMYTRILDLFAAWGESLGLFTRPSSEFLEEFKAVRVLRKGVDPAQVEKLVAKRTDAKKNKDFATADTIRDQLAEMSVEVRDTPAGPVWDLL